MDDYRWFDYQNQSLEERFPPTLRWLLGRNEWEDGLQRLLTGAGLDPRWLDDIRQAGRRRTRGARPRVFVSHRQTDDGWARRIAWYACRAGLDYWLDVLDLDRTRDPQVQLLERRLGRRLTSEEFGLITAALIEMALLNCTHVIAVMTSSTAGSRWVPYEYGRVKAPAPIAVEAAAWHDWTSLPRSDLPEYLHLGPVLPNEGAIQSYFSACAHPGPVPAGPPGIWSEPTPPTLPTG